MTLDPTVLEIDRAVRGYVAAGSGIEAKLVIEANRDGPAPARGLYATVFPFNRRSRGTRWTVDRGVPAEVQIQGEYIATYSVQWLNAGARAAAQQFTGWVGTPASLRRATDGRFAFVRISEIRDISNVIESEWEERMNADLVIGYVQALDATITRFAAPDNTRDILLELTREE